MSVLTKRVIFMLLCLTATGGAFAGDLQLLNPELLGKESSDRIEVFLPADEFAVRASAVEIDINGGMFFAATVRYPQDVTFDQARAALNKLYKKHERKSFARDDQMGLWRNEEGKFAIQLTRGQEGVVVIYICIEKRTENGVTSHR
jgi:hypothetical protein